MTQASPASPTSRPADWPAHVPHQIEVPNESLWQGFAARAAATPDAVGLHFLGRDYTWATLVQEAEQLAGALQALGVQRGDRVLLFMQNCPQYVVGFHAVLRAGAVVVPVNPMNKADELGHYIHDAQAKVALASSDIAQELAQASAGLPAGQGLQHLVWFDLADGLPETPDTSDWPSLWQHWLPTRHAAPHAAGLRTHRWAELLAQAPAPLPLQASGEDLALLPYTSGTTGAAKGCLHTHATLLHNALGAGPWLGMGPGDVTLIVVPMFHITGLVMGMLASIRHGCRIVLLPRWDRRVAVRAISAHGVTHWPNIPTMVIDLLGSDDLNQYRLNSLRYIGGGGAPMPDAVAARLQEVFGLRYVEGYGLTETAAPTHINPMHAPRRHCLGMPWVGTRALVIDPETLQPLPVGEPGEIVVNGPQVFHGYWQQPQATAEAFIEIDGVRYFRTGDIGRQDEDGFFFMADRLKRMINASGFKVWPAEVEAMLHKHPAIKESCVIATRDPYRGESVKALVVLRDSHRGQATADDLIAWAREHMAAYKYPREVELVDELPRTATGKVLWRQAQAEQDQRDAARLAAASAPR
jgi:fatty-acyl-CoA synthase